MSESCVAALEDRCLKTVDEFVTFDFTGIEFVDIITSMGLDCV